MGDRSSGASTSVFRLDPSWLRIKVFSKKRKEKKMTDQISRAKLCAKGSERWILLVDGFHAGHT